MHSIGGNGFGEQMASLFQNDDFFFIIAYCILVCVLSFFSEISSTVVHSNTPSPGEVIVSSSGCHRRIISKEKVGMRRPLPEHTSAKCEVKQTFNKATVTIVNYIAWGRSGQKEESVCKKPPKMWFWLNAQFAVDESVILIKWPVGGEWTSRKLHLGYELDSAHSAWKPTARGAFWQLVLL